MGTYKKQLFGGYQPASVEVQRQKNQEQLQASEQQIAMQQTQIIQLQTDYRELEKQNEELTKKVEKLSQELVNYDNIEQTLSTALVVAQEAAQNLRVMAAKEAQLIVKEAQEQAKQEVNEARQMVQTIQMQEEQLKRESQVFKTRIRMLLEAQLELNAEEIWQQIFESRQENSQISVDGDQVNQD
ncbi:MAG: DivIVA domain-containing protein [Culicoidibacterales bacterium]